MAASSELIATLVVLVMKPFSLFKLFCIFCLKTSIIVIHTWIEIIKAGISLHVNILWRVILWSVALISLPFRVLTAIQRERQLETQQQIMQLELENMLWDMKEVEGRLQKAATECKLMELMLLELEDEHDKTIEQVQFLEKELHGVKKENRRLKEIQGKDIWNYKSQGNHDTSKNKYQVPCKTGSDRGGSIALRELLVDKDRSQDNIDDIPETDPGLHQQREVAMKRSLFSAVLSFVVGMIVWEARDPCMPLVIALFTVVGMSLISVVGFFSTIRNKPASDAVALLSLNCFILGTLTYPTLPRVACMFAPLAVKVLDRTVRWLGVPPYLLANSTAFELDF